jgi:endonuclease YncB( thermonuclease family)
MSMQPPSGSAPPRNSTAGSKSRSGASGDTGTKSLGALVGKVVGLVVALIILALLARFCGIEQDVHFMVKDKVAAIDGDTLRSANAEVRIYGIDTPELDQTCTDQNGKDWTCGRDAQAKLNALVARRAVDCTPKGRDKFNRTVAICRTSAVPDLGEALVREGLAVNFGVGDKPGPYEAAQADAQAAKRGVWRGTFQQPADWRQAHPRDGN